MSELSPYSHSCVEHPTLSCPACKWVEERRTVDVLVRDEGTIWLVRPLSERAKAWVAYVAAEPWQCLCVCRKLEKLTRLLTAADAIRRREVTLRELRKVIQ